MRLRLTQRAIDSLSTPPGAKDLMVWDKDLPGFGVRVYYSGRKAFFAQYTVGTAKRRVSLGNTPPVTLAKARADAQLLLAQVANGADPAASETPRAKRGTANTLAPATPETLDAIIERYFEVKEKHKKASTVTEQRRIYRKDIGPVLGRRPVAAIERREVSALHHDLSEKPVLANRIIFLLRNVFNWCEIQGIRPEGINPARRIPLYTEKPRDKFASATELKRLRRAWQLERVERGFGDIGLAAIAFAALTGWRKQEVFTLKWAALDLRAGVAVLEDTKTGKSQRTLSAVAVSLLRTIPRRTGCDYVFPNASGKPISDPRAAWDAIRQRSGVTDLTLHGLRHTFASVALDIGLPYEVRQALIGHKAEGMTAQYSHVRPEVLREAADRVATALCTQMQFGRHGMPAEHAAQCATDYAAGRIFSLA